MVAIVNFRNGEQNGAVSPPPSEPFRLSGKTQNYKVQLETNVDGGNIKASSITLQKEVTTRSGKDYQAYATSYDGGKTWYEPGVKPLKKISTSTGLSADEIKSLQPGGELNKKSVESAQLVAQKNGASTLQKNQIKDGNDANTNPTADPTAADREAIEKELKNVRERKKEEYTQVVKYPEKLNLDYQDCIKFSMLKYQQSGLNLTVSELNQVQRSVSINNNGIPTVGEKREILTTIVLPIPGGISDSNTVDWQGNELDEITKAFAGIAQGAITGGGAGAEQKIDQAGKAAEKNIGGLQQTVVSKLVQNATGASGIMQRQYGAIINPNIELLFNGPQLRTFSFNFKLSPRSEEEARLVKKIIRYFKQGMTPKRSSGYLLLQSPHTFAISYVTENKQHPYLNRFKECALTQCNVNYTPDGNYMSFNGKERSMTSYELTLQFQELVPLFDDDYGSKDDNIGF
jgi:hypothetical protein